MTDRNQESSRILPEDDKSNINYDAVRENDVPIDENSINGDGQEKNDITIDNSPDTGAQTTNLECLMHLLKGMLGTGILAMPVAFLNGGLWFSIITVLFLGFISTHCMHILVKCRNKLAEKTNDENLDFARVFEKAFATRKDNWNKYDKAAKRVVNVFLVITQIGFCCIYTVFVAQNVQQVLEHLFHYSLNDKLYVLFVAICLVPYFMVRSLKALVPFSTVANILNWLGLVIILYDLFQDLPDVSTRPALPEIADLPIFFGQVVFSFEGIGLVIPLHHKMEQRDAFLGWNGILNLGLTITVCLYAAVGFFGFLKYGSAVEGSITLNLSLDFWLYLVAKVMFAVSIFITCGLQFYVPINIMWPAVVRKCTERNIGLPKYSEFIFRIFLIFIICGISALVPHLDLLISLVGACASSFLLLIFPPVIQLFSADLNPLLVTKDVFIVVVGLVGFATGTFSSLRDIVHTF